MPSRRTGDRVAAVAGRVAAVADAFAAGMEDELFAAARRWWPAWTAATFTAAWTGTTWALAVLVAPVALVLVLALGVYVVALVASRAARAR